MTSPSFQEKDPLRRAAWFNFYCSCCFNLICLLRHVSLNTFGLVFLILFNWFGFRIFPSCFSLTFDIDKKYGQIFRFSRRILICKTLIKSQMTVVIAISHFIKTNDITNRCVPNKNNVPKIPMPNKVVITNSVDNKRFFKFSIFLIFFVILITSETFTFITF